MKKKIIIAGISLILFAGTTQAATWVGFKEGMSSPTPPEIKVVKEDDSGITLEANVFGVNVEAHSTEHGARSVGTQTFQLLTIPGYEYSFTQEIGKPKMPVIQIMLAIPDGVEISLSSTSSAFCLLPPAYPIYPVPKQVVKTTSEGYSHIAEEFSIDEEFYRQDLWYPEIQNPKSKIQNCKIASIGYIRDQRILRLEIYPIQFNPAKKQLRVYSNLKIEINYLRKKGAPVSLGQPQMAWPFANVLKHAILNYKLPSTSYLPLPAKRIGTARYITNLKNPFNSADYLIITSEAYYNNPDLAKLAKHRAEYNGFDVAVVNTTSIYNEFPITEKGTTTSIKEFIRYVYYNWSAPSMDDNHLGYVLIFGDGEEKYTSYVPVKPLQEIHLVPTVYPVADTWYVCINDENLYYDYWTVDIMMGRLPVESGTDTKVMVDKIIEYEKNPQQGQWRNRILTAEGLDGLDFAPIIDNYLLPAEFEVTKIEETGTGGMIVKAINEGCLLINYSGHGSPIGWAMSQAPNSPFDTYSVKELSNGSKLPVVFAVACDTADFRFEYKEKWPDCLAEALLKKEGGGAIAYWGASGVTSAFTNIYVIKAYQFMTEHTPNSFFLGELTLNPYFQSWTHEWNLLGDPALTISRTGVEQNTAELEVEPTDISFVPQSPKPSENTNIFATIHNLGDIDATNVLVKFFLGDPEDNGLEIGSKTITNISVEGTQTIEINWIPDVPIGEYKIYVVIDPYDAIPEAGTINNTTYKPIEINIYQKGWYQSHPQSPRIEISPAVGDIDGDGDLEVVCAVTGNYVYIWHHNGEFVDNWPKLITVEEKGDIAGTPPILADIDNDNELEIILSGMKRFYILNHDGSNVPGFPKEGTNSSPLAIGDIDGDGDLEIIVKMSNKLYAFHHDGTLVEGDWPKEINCYHAIIADINKKGNPEIVILSADSKVYVFEGDGKLVNGDWPRTIPSDNNSPNVFAVGNFDNDDELEIVIAPYYTKPLQGPKINLYVLNYDGTDVEGYPKEIGELYSSSTVLGDIDNDGDMEVIIDSLYYTYVLHHDGNNVTGWPKGGSPKGPTHALVGDMNNDKQLEIIEGEYYLYKGTVTIWNNNGSLKGNLFMKPWDKRTSPFVIADIDLDGDIEVICAGEEFMHIAWALPKVYIWDYEGKCKPGALEWPMANHDARRTNCYNTDITNPAKINDLQAQNPTPYAIDLNWTATGDDKNYGTANAYYIRYATFTITPQNWHLTNKATCTIIPKSSGSQESFTVPNLQPNTTYYFCIRARDEESNTAPLSNVPFAITLSPAVITVSPTQGVVGKIVTLWGNNFYPTEPVRISFGNTVTVAFVNATGGSFTITFTVTDEGFGSVTVTGYGFESGYTATTHFFIPGVQYFGFGTISSPQSAGQGFGIKITAFNEYGEVVTNFKGTATLSDIFNSILPTVTSSFIDGIWQGTVTITKAGTTSITADYADKIGTSNTFLVTPGSITKIVFITATQTITAGLPSAVIIIQTQDNYGNPANVGTDTVINLKSTSQTGKFSVSLTPWSNIATITIALGTNSAGFYYKDITPGNFIITVDEAPEQNWTAGTQTIKILPALLSHFEFGTITNQIAGLEFLITITAKTVVGEVAVDFTNTVTLVDESNTILPKITTNFINGIWAGTVTITKSGTTSITASYAGKIGTSNPFYVEAGTPTKFIVKPQNAVDVPAGGSVSITAQLMDAYNNPVGSSGISCNLAVVVIVGTAGKLSTMTVTTDKNGQIGTITYAVSTRAGDKAKLSISNYQLTIINYSGTITTIPADLHHFTFAPIATQTAGVHFPITVTAKDQYENTVGSFQDTTTLSDSTNSLNPKQTSVFTAGSWQGIGSITVAGTTNITASYSPLKKGVRGLSIFGTSNQFRVLGGSLTYFEIASIATQTAGIGFNLTIRAKDRWGNVADGFTGIANLTLTPQPLPLNPSTTTNFTAGLWQGTVAITKAGTTAITVTYQDKTGTSNPFAVIPASLDHFIIGTITNQTAGADFTITITAKDRWENVVDGFTGIADLHSPLIKGVRGMSSPLLPTTTTNFTAGFWQGSVTITKAGTTTIFAEYQGKRGTSNPFVVTSASLHHFRFDPIPNQTAGQGFNITIVACDAFENTVLTYTGTNTLTDTTGSILPGVTTNFNQGELRDFPVAISIAGNGVIITTKGNGVLGQSLPFNVTPGNLDHFRIGTITSPQKAGVGFLITIQAEDSQNNITNYQGVASLSDAGNTILPTATTNFSTGRWQGFVSITRVGSTTILVQAGGKYGVRNGFKVIVGDLAKIAISPEYGALRVNESQVFTASGVDAYGNEAEVIGNRWSVIGNIVGSLSPDVGSKTTFVAGTKVGTGTLKCSFGEITATASITITPGDLANIIIDPAQVTIEVGGTCTLTARGYDRYGNEKEVIGNRWSVIGNIGRLVDTLGSRATFVAGIQPQEGTITYQSAGIVGSSRITVRHGRVAQFEFDPIPHQVINTSFKVRIKALDRYRNLVTDYNCSASFTTTCGSVEPKSGNFSQGIFEDTLTIKTNRAAVDVSISVESNDIKQPSPGFAVLYDDAKKISVEEMGIKLDIDAHSVSKDYYLEISQPSLNEHNIEIANLRIRDDLALKQLNETIIRVIPKDGDKNPITTKPGTNATTLTIYYSQPASNIAPETLKLHILDDSGIEAKWVEVKGSVVLTGINMAYANIPQFGTFILIGSTIPANLDELVVYPNPFKPLRGDTKIIFEGLPAHSYIRIYDISGHLIKEAQNQQAIWQWDVQDNYGQKVDSGIYIYIVTTEDGLKKIGKIAVIR